MGFARFKGGSSILGKGRLEAGAPGEEAGAPGEEGFSERGDCSREGHGLKSQYLLESWGLEGLEIRVFF